MWYVRYPQIGVSLWTDFLFGAIKINQIALFPDFLMLHLLLFPVAISPLFFQYAHIKS